MNTSAENIILNQLVRFIICSSKDLAGEPTSYALNTIVLVLSPQPLKNRAYDNMKRGK